MRKLFHLLLIKSRCCQTLITCLRLFSCRFSLSLLPKNTPNVTSFHQCRLLHITLSRKGLEEFFDDPKNWGEEKVKSGEIFRLMDIKYIYWTLYHFGLFIQFGNYLDVCLFVFNFPWECLLEKIKGRCNSSVNCSLAGWQRV